MTCDTTKIRKKVIKIFDANNVRWRERQRERNGIYYQYEIKEIISHRMELMICHSMTQLMKCNGNIVLWYGASKVKFSIYWESIDKMWAMY